VEALLPAERIEVHLQWVGPEERRLVLIGKGRGASRLVTQLGKQWGKED